MKRTLRSRQNLGKYRIEKLLAQGGFAEVYQAFDTIEGLRVALKIPYAHLMDSGVLEDFRREVRVTAQLEHPNILPIKNAEFVDGHFVIALPLGERTLADRLKSRMSMPLAVHLAGQMLEALGFAHHRRILHCDVKPENFILFSGNRLRLSDFGIAKVSLHTVSASGSGTLGYIAPEQAMGKPSFRSDVFSLGLIFYRMFAGVLPQWPFVRPFPGSDRLKERVHPEFAALIHRATALEPKKRFENADQMRRAFQKLRQKTSAKQRQRRKRSRPPRQDWKEVRWRQFLRQYGAVLEVRGECPKCAGPVAECMPSCCWCGVSIAKYRGKARFGRQCSRCRRSLKADWRFCPWCFGASLSGTSERALSDRRYEAKCQNPACTRKTLMPFMRYCPWCRHKVRRPWAIPGASRKCAKCKWGIVDAFWDHCPWCGVGIKA